MSGRQKLAKRDAFADESQVVEDDACLRHGVARAG